MAMAMREDFRQREDYRKSTNGIRRLKRRLHDTASRADTLRREKSDYQSNMTKLEMAHPEWTQVNFRDSTGHFIFLVGALAVYLLDIQLFGPSIEVLAERAFSDYPQVSLIARFATPAAVIFLEMLLAMQIYYSKRDSETYLTANPAYYGWVLIGILGALVMPSLVLSASMVESSSSDSQALQNGLYLQSFGLAALALVMHVPILFGGHRAHEAKSYFSFRRKFRSLERGIRRCDRGYTAETRSLRGDFDSFYDLLNRHRQSFRDNYEPGVWDQTTRNILREIHGYDVIRTDSNNVTGPAPTANPNDWNENSFHHGTQDNDNASTGEANSESDSRVREEESEVKL